MTKDLSKELDNILNNVVFVGKGNPLFLAVHDKWKAKAKKQLSALIAERTDIAEKKGRYEGQAEIYNDLWKITQTHKPYEGTLKIVKRIADWKDRIEALKGKSL